jgi:hypothetical protein
MKTKNHTNPGRSRRGVLLLLVLSALTMFMMLGALMLVLATRARTSARAFATASNTVSRDDSRSRAALDEAMMQLLRGPMAAGPVTESILADRYGTAVTMGQLTGLNRVNAGLLRATLTGVAAGTPLALNGRVLTIKPPPSDPAPISSYRILSYSGNTVELANLRTSMPFRTLPAAASTCMAIVNGRDFDNSAGNEAWDEPGAANPFLTEAQLQATDATILVTRPAFGTPGQACQVDNDGDGMADGVWLSNVLPPQTQENGSTLTYRVSYLVLDMDGRFNVNAHGLRSGATDPGIGPASVDGSTALGAAVWNRLLNGGTIPAASPPAAQQRRPTPALGYDVDGRFGTMGNGTSQYDLRLDFDGPRPGSPSLAGERVGCGNLPSQFTAGEMERLMRPFDSDAAALPPRLAGILGDEAQKARMRVTTDSWDTTGLVGQAASKVAAVASATGLPQAVIDGRRFDINASMANAATYADWLYNVIVAAGVNHEKSRQWVANVIDYRDKDALPATVTISGTSVTGNEASQYTSLGGNAASEMFTSIGQLLCVPRGSQQDLADPQCPPELKRSLAVDFPVILDAVMVASPFAMTVAANPWREPGRVNVNTCDDDVWKAVLGGTTANPYAPAQSTGNMLTNASLLFSDPERTFTSVNVARANRLANIATTRSNVFGAWVTVEITDSAAPDQKAYRRAFAIVDRSIPVGYCPGVNLNARDTLRLVRYLE